MLSVIDMPPPDESIWWRGKRGFEVGFFPCECVEVIAGDKVPQGLKVFPNDIKQRKDSTGSDDHESPLSSSNSSNSSSHEPSKPVLRKHGKLISFFRSFILSRPNRGKLKKSGILKERVFGCDLSEHLLNSGHPGKRKYFFLTKKLHAEKIKTFIFFSQCQKFSSIVPNSSKPKESLTESTGFVE